MSLPFVIERCYDSHVHWLPTGELSAQARIDGLATPAEWRTILRGAPARGEWRLLFGWGGEIPGAGAMNADSLVELDSAHPVMISHRSGHASVVNAAGLAALGWRHLNDLPESLRPYVGAKKTGELTGHFSEKAHFEVLSRLPIADTETRRRYLIAAQDKFLAAGFTHIREMMADASLLQDARLLEGLRQLKLHVDLNMFVENVSRVEEALATVREFRRERSRRLRIEGLKVFLDGALGTGTAALSFPYVHSDDAQGALLWRAEDLATVLSAAWTEGLKVAVHAIGDAAMTQILQVAQSLRARGVEGPIALEHAELIAPPAFKLMRGLALEFHFQPAHYLDDQPLLAQKLGGAPVEVMPWHRVEVMGFPIYFGSDTPVSEPSLARTLRGLRTAAQAGVPALELDWKFAHSHPDRKFGANARTTIDEDGNILRVEAGD